MSIFYENSDDYKEAQRVLRKGRDAYGKTNPEMGGSTKDKDRIEKATKMVANKTGRDYDKDEKIGDLRDIHAVDATDRHLRKHPVKESTSIFY